MPSLKRTTLSLYFLCSLTLLNAQDESALSVSIPAKGLRYATVDRAGYLYVVTDEGITRYSENGDSLAYAPLPHITLFDPGNGVRLLAYQRKDQRYTLLSPSLTPIGTYPFDLSTVIEPWLVCSGGDYDIFILDAADGTLKNVDVRTGQVRSDFALNDTVNIAPAITLAKAYQHFIFLLDKQAGIRIYNPLGIAIRCLPVTGIDYFNFLGEELYYFQQGQVHFINLFTGEHRARSLPFLPARGIDYLILTDRKCYAVTKNAVDIFTFVPEKTPVPED